MAGLFKKKETALDATGLYERAECPTCGNKEAYYNMYSLVCTTCDHRRALVHRLRSLHETLEEGHSFTAAELVKEAIVYINEHK